MNLLTLEQGTKLVKLSREILTKFVMNNIFRPKECKEDYMKEKRGCIGYPYPVKALCVAVQEVTVAAASQDPRFVPISKDEINRIAIEVSVLTTPEEIKIDKRENLPERIRIGTDGIIISRANLSGLLLPQVATEYCMDAETFLSEACMKAGLPPDSWLLPDVSVARFQAEVFSEVEPCGEVVKL